MKKTIKKTLTYSSLLLLLAVFLFACKKEKNENPPKDVLTGAWSETLLQATSRFIVFGPGNTFTMSIRNANDESYLLTLNGKYLISGKTLTINITEQIEKKASGTVKTTVNQKLYENATFSIANTILTINYTSYPADAPVATQVKFSQILPID